LRKEDDDDEGDEPLEWEEELPDEPRADERELLKRPANALLHASVAISATAAAPTNR